MHMKKFHKIVFFPLLRAKSDSWIVFIQERQEEWYFHPMFCSCSREEREREKKKKERGIVNSWDDAKGKKNLEKVMLEMFSPLLFEMFIWLKT